MQAARKFQHGFTLVEMIIVIVVTGIIVSVVAIFIRAPVEGYLNSASRAEMTDIADTALRRIGRDLRTAVPNSVRVPNSAGTNTYIEFLPTRNGGRYRAVAAPSGTAQCGGSLAQDILDFTYADNCFEVIGPALPLVFSATEDSSDQIVIGSTQSSGNPPYDKTSSGVRRPYTGATGSPAFIQFKNVQFPSYAQLTGQRFDIVPFDQQAVTYACVGTLGVVDANGDGRGQLVRYWAYGYKLAQLAPASLGVTPAVLADKVFGCSIVYDTFNQRSGLVAITLTLTRSNETVSLYHEIHVNNIP